MWDLVLEVAGPPARTAAVEAAVRDLLVTHLGHQWGLTLVAGSGRDCTLVRVTPGPRRSIVLGTIRPAQLAAALGLPAARPGG